MAFPASFKAAIISALQTYLEAETASAAEPSLQGDIEWGYNSNVHLPTQNPKGLVLMVGSNPTLKTTTGLIQEEIRIRLRLLVSKKIDPAARDAAITNEDLMILDQQLFKDIEEELINAEQFLFGILYKIRTQGTLTVTVGSKTRVVLAGHKIAGSPSRIITTMDREGRSTGALVMDVLWDDGGLFASQHSHSNL